MKTIFQLVAFVFVVFSFSNAYAESKAAEDAYMAYKQEKVEMDRLLKLIPTLNGSDYCNNLQQLIVKTSNTEAALLKFSNLSTEQESINAAKAFLAKFPDMKAQIQTKYQTNCSSAALKREENNRIRNGYVAQYNQNIKDADNYRQEAIDIIKRNGSQSYLCSAFRSERESLYRAHSALYATFGLVPELDYRGETTAKELEKKFDQNKLDIDAEGC